MQKIFTVGLGLFCTFLTAQELVFVEFKDKPQATVSLAQPLSILSQDALDRRNKRGVNLDERDVPLEVTYVQQVKKNFPILGHSKWLNGVVVNAKSEQDILTLSQLPFVNKVETFVQNPKAVRTENKVSKFTVSTRNLDRTKAHVSDEFIQQLNLQVLHNQGFTGKNVKLAVIDAGFPYVNTMQAFANSRNNGRIKFTYDFVTKSTDVYNVNSNDHGTMVLSNIAAKTPEYTGTGYDADLYLFRTEDAATETPLEMVYWVMAAEKADSLGVDIINTSLGYYEFDDARYNYSKDDLDGKTTYITRGANIAAEKGMILVISAGNERSSPWGKISAPADAHNVLSIGAVDLQGNIAYFSSYGPTADNRIKPDVVALGVSVPVYNYGWWGEEIVRNNGTSFSSPITAGAVASLIQKYENFTVAQIIEAVHQAGNRFQNPNNDYGHGIPDFAKAMHYLDENLSTSVFANQNLEIYPNPTKDWLTVKSATSINRLEILDTNGRVVRAYSKKNTISLKSLLKGVYFVKIYFSDGKAVTQKIIKQ